MTRLNKALTALEILTSKGFETTATFLPGQSYYEIAFQMNIGEDLPYIPEELTPSDIDKEEYEDYIYVMIKYK